MRETTEINKIVEKNVKEEGVLEEECSKVLKDFFKDLRARKKQAKSQEL